MRERGNVRESLRRCSFDAADLFRNLDSLHYTIRLHLESSTKANLTIKRAPSRFLIVPTLDVKRLQR
jgi:hypothetical protein